MSKNHIAKQGKTKKKFKGDFSEAYFKAEIARLNHIFPLSDSTSAEPNIPLRRHIASHLPPRQEADYLWEQARENALTLIPAQRFTQI